jgi:prophage tail gpP-like protein
LNNDRVKVEIQDRSDPTKWETVDRWDGYTIQQSAFQPCDNFSLQPVPELYDKFKAGGQRVKIYLNDALRFTGITDERSHNTNKDRRELSITGRCVMQCIYDATAEPVSLRNKTLAELAELQCAPWLGTEIEGITTENAANFYKLIGRKPRVVKKSKQVNNPLYLLDPAAPEKVTATEIKRVSGIKGGKLSPQYRGTDQDKIRDTWVDGSQKRWDVLKEHADRVACTMWGTCDGFLFIGRPRYDEFIHEPSLVFTPSGRGNNVRDARFTVGTAERFSDYRFYAQGRGGRADKGLAVINHKITVQDPGEAFFNLNVDGTLDRRFYRPTVINVKRGIQDTKLLRRLARSAMEWNAIQTYKYEVDVDGHHWPWDEQPYSESKHTMWAHDCCVDVRDEVNGISGAHWISGVDPKDNSTQGNLVTLHLIPAGIWLALDHDSVSEKEYSDYMRWRLTW